MQNFIKQIDDILTRWSGANFITESDQNDVRRDLGKLRTALAAAPASDEVLAELEALLKEATPGPWFVISGQRVTLLAPQANVPHDSDDNANDFAGFIFPANAHLTAALRNAAPALLARVRQAEALRPWLPTTEMLPVPEGCTVRLWVCIEGVVSELHYGYRVEMDENWEDEEPYTGWLEEGDENGMPVYHGPLPTHYKEQEPAPAAPTVKGGQPNA